MPTSNLGLTCDSAISEKGQLFGAFYRSLHLREDCLRLRHDLRGGRILLKNSAERELASKHGTPFSPRVSYQTLFA